jgi:hypothetical protein
MAAPAPPHGINVQDPLDPGVGGGGGAPPLGVAPQLPCGADPGSITGWMLQATMAETPSTISLQMERSFARLVGMPPVNHHDYAAARRDMIDEILNSNSLETYLMVSNHLYREPRVTVIHSLFRYSAGFGGRNALHGKVVGMLGETVGGQLPPLVRFQDDNAEDDFASALVLENVNVQPAAAVTAYFTGPAALEVMPAVTVAAGAVATDTSCLCPIPLAWAPYFLDFKTPYDAYRMGTGLVGTMTTDAERLRMDPFLVWLRACTQRQGAHEAQRGLSVLDQVVMDATPAPRVTLELTARLHRFRLPMLAVPPVQPLAGPVPAVLAPAGAATEYSEMESDLLLASCGISDAEWTTELPILYERMLAEGRTVVKVRSILQVLTRPKEISMDAIALQITDDMARDVKDLNFGSNNDTSYSGCHRGISPFTVVPVLSATAAKRKRREQRLMQVTSIRYDDLPKIESNPDPLPKDFAGLLHLLKSYMALLMVVVGVKCPHYIQVRSIGLELNSNRQAFENVNARDVATIVWQIFLDSRRFFTDAINDTGTPPVSRLAHLLGNIQAGHIPVFNNVPFRELLVPTDETPGGGDPAGTAAREPRRGGAAETPGQHLTLTYSVPRELAAVFQGGLTRYPGLRISEVMAAHSPPTPYHKYKLGPGGTCMDFLCLGKCTNPTCSYKHNVSLRLSSPNLASRVALFKVAFDAYKIAHP